jgi:hypothetical protein
MSSINQNVDVVVSNCFGTVRSGKLCKATRIDRVVCVLVFLNEGGTGLIEKLSPGVVFKLPVSFNICSTPRCEL